MPFLIKPDLRGATLSTRTPSFVAMSPLRWGPALAELQRWLRLLTRRDVVRGSPERAARIVVLALCTTASASVAGWRRWPGPAA